MSYYRIQIDELQNGEKMHIPQVGKLVIKNRPFQQTQEIKWYNILQDGGRYALSKTTTESYDKEEDALSIITTYKGIDIYEEGKKLKSTTYKMIDLW
jgi:hypothetical protein